MKKLTLSLDALQVESFETLDVEAGRGTVRGNGTESYGGMGCESTANRDVCDCTGGSYGNGTCDNTYITCNGFDETCYAGCDGYSNVHCATEDPYISCYITCYDCA